MQNEQAKITEEQPKAGLAAGVFFLVWATVGWAGLWFNGPLLRTLSQPGLDPGPALLPIFVSVALSLGAIWLIVKNLKKWRPLSVNFAVLPLLPAGFLTSAVLTAVWIARDGFLLPSYIFAALWMYLLAPTGADMMRRVLSALVIPALIVGGVWTVFVALLRVPLP